MAGTESSSFCGPMLPYQPLPPTAQAPNPMRVMWRSLFPSCRVSIETLRLHKDLHHPGMLDSRFQQNVGVVAFFVDAHERTHGDAFSVSRNRGRVAHGI